MKTYLAKPADIERKWFVVDAAGAPLGRVATTVADILTGKTKTIYTPGVDCGDFVVVINSDKAVLTGKKLEQKMYRHHTGYVGGLKEEVAKDVLAKKPEFVVAHAIKGMLPKNALGRKMFKKCKLYAVAEHEHQAQKPEVLKF